MNSVRVSPRRLEGNISVPPSKSAAHRAIICAALSEGESVLHNAAMSEDIRATVRCMRALGAEISLSGSTLTVRGILRGKNNRQNPCDDGSDRTAAGSADTDNGSYNRTAAGSADTDNESSDRTAGNEAVKPDRCCGDDGETHSPAVLDCGESGSTLRFLIPVAAALGAGALFTGHGRLPQRPIGVFSECLPEKGVRFVTKGGLPLSIGGRLESGRFEVPGDISSQFITGLLLALPLLDGDSEIVLSSPLQSSGYVDMTVCIMKSFGADVVRTEKGWFIRGGQSYKARSFTIEGDWSQAAFFMTAAALGGRITIDNLDPDSAQGDKSCTEIYSRFGARISTDKDGRITIEGGELHAADINASDIPDMVPALAVTAALCEGTTRITGAQRLRIKESDRLAAMTNALSALGADISELPDGLVIKGVKTLHGGSVDGCNDHRIVMASAMASCRCDGDIIISDMESINKSYPDFFDDMARLGGAFAVVAEG